MRRIGASEQSAVMEVVNTVNSFVTCVWFLRAFLFVACVSIGVWTFANPQDALDAILRGNVHADASSYALVTPNANLSSTSSSSVVTIPDANEVLRVFVRTFATLIVVAACGIPSRYDRMSRLLSLAGYLLAFGLFMDVTIRDHSRVLDSRFVTVYTTFACGVPAIVCGLEARYPDMIF